MTQLNNAAPSRPPLSSANSFNSHNSSSKSNSPKSVIFPSLADSTDDLDIQTLRQRIRAGWESIGRTNRHETSQRAYVEVLEQRLADLEEKARHNREVRQQERLRKEQADKQRFLERVNSFRVPGSATARNQPDD